MHFGIYLSNVAEFSDPTLLAELAHEAEAEGWEGVFIWDHIGGPGAVVDPWVALAGMAMKTEKVRLGTVVTPLPRRRPWKLARETVAIDQLSKGRLTLGVGLGWSRREFEAFGEDGELKTRAEKLEEGLEVLTGLWRGEPFDYHGRYYQIDGECFLPPPVQSPRIPVWVCGTWPEKKAPFRRAAGWDGVVAILDPAMNRAILPQEVAAIREYIQAHRSVPGPFDIVLILWSQGETPTEVRSESARQAAEYEEAGATWWLEDLSTERFNSVEQVRERLHQGPPGI